jgi:enoyl-CoA hydratase/carnithine racemase
MFKKPTLFGTRFPLVKTAPIISEEGKVIEDAIQIATNFASMSQPIVKLIKESINNSYESSLQVGLESERKSFYSTFSLEDKNEGMNAFIEKRKANFKNR